MKKRLSGLVAATLLAWAAAAPHASATGVFCGAGIITSVGRGSNQSPDGNYSQSNIFFKLDNSINFPGSGAAFLTMNHTTGWQMISEASGANANDTRFRNIADQIMRAYLSGVAIKVWNNQDIQCADMADTSVIFQMCNNTTDCSYTGTPN